MGRYSILVACLTPLIALVAGCGTCVRAGGDMGGVAGFLGGLSVATVGFAIGALVGLLGLIRDDSRAKAAIGLVCNLGGQIAILGLVGWQWDVYWHLYSYWFWLLVR